MVLVRILSAVITSFLICLTMAWKDTVPKSKQLIGVDYSSFTENLLIPFIILTLLFLVVAVPFSLFLDQTMKGKRINSMLREIVSMFFYMIGGAGSLLVFIFMMNRSFQIINHVGPLLYGGFIALSYYLVIRIMEYIFFRSSRSRVHR